MLRYCSSKWGHPAGEVARSTNSGGSFNPNGVCGSRLQMKDRELQSQKAALEKTTAGLEDQKKQLLQVSPPPP